MSTAPLAYALARAHARHGQRPSEAEWHRLALAPGRGECLLAARETGLASHLETLGDDENVDVTERRLRERASRYAVEVARWMPPAWRPAGEWLAWLPYLDLCDYLQRDGTPYPWMADESRIADREILAAAQDVSPGTAWREHWPRLWPRAARAGPRLALALQGAAVPPWPESGLPLLRLFRGRSASVIALFAHVGLVLADLRRLAGLLAGRLPHPVDRMGAG